MTGSITISVKDSRNSYAFTLKRNITILSGDSGRGKTTLYEMIADYNRNGKASGVKLVCNRDVIAVEGIGWQEQIERCRDCVIVIDEDNGFIRSKDFAGAIKNSSNYYLLITRCYIGTLPYSVDEIYEIKGKKNKKFETIYKGLEHMYDGITPRQLPFKPDIIITEDSNSGYQFFKAAADLYHIDCVSANGKSQIIRAAAKYSDRNVLIIADGAAFGPEMQDAVRLQQLRPRKIGIFLPESFEWLILKSGLVSDPEWEKVSIPEMYADSEHYFSWERYFTDLLAETTKDMEYKRYPVSKSNLPEFYTQERSIEQVRTNMRGIQFEEI